VRVIEQARLWFREGTSDKVYEVDLVEVAPNQYVVNFRYGRRGSALSDGTKTATPVDLAKARAIFGKLVAEKTAGGYKPMQVAPAAPDDDDEDEDDEDEDDAHPDNDLTLEQRVVARLRRGNRGNDALGPWVWKASDHDLKAAEPALLELIDAPEPDGLGNTAWRHSVTCALARCGTTAALPALEKLAADTRTKQCVRDIAKLAIVRIAPDRAVALATPALPAALDHQSPELLARSMEELLARDPAKAHAAAVALYLLDTAAVRGAGPPGSPYRTGAAPASSATAARTAVLALARVARLNNAEAAVVRGLYRLAEVRRDPELFVLCARRIDEYNGGNYRPFSRATVQYFRRRVARVLRRLGRAGSPDYVRMASALLLSYTDADAQQPRRAYGGAFDRFARYHAFNDILYGASPRYRRASHVRSAWRMLDPYKPGDPPPAQREERWPRLWDDAPDRLWQTIREARTAPVAHFATRALRDNRAYVDRLPDDVLAQLLGSGHPIAQRFAFDMVRDRPMTVALVRGALASEVVEANTWVLRWVADHQDDVAGDAEMLALLLTGKTSNVRDAGLVLLRGRPVAEPILQSVAARTIAVLLGMRGDEGERAAAVTAVLLRVLEAPLRRLGPEVLRDLIGHPLATVGEFAGELMLRHADRDHLPASLVEALLSSPHASVRVLGGRMLALTPAEIAKDDIEALVLFATSPNKELRESTRTLLREISARYPDAARALADRLVDALLTAQPDGVPAHIITLLRGELAETLPAKPAKTILRLIGALSPHAREAGGLLLGQVSPDEIGLDDVVRLASHEILAIRQGAWSLVRHTLPRFKLAPVAIAKLVDSPWADTRELALALVRDELKPLSAEAIIAICDSIRPEVQAVGKQLLLEQFDAKHAGTYLVKLAEHPSTSIQLLVSGLLDHYLTDVRSLEQLAPYLVTVLSQVNRGRVAKERVIAILRREATKSAAAAAVIAPILDRQSASIAITQKHPLIATMVDVKLQYPATELPITVVPAPAYKKAGAS